MPMQRERYPLDWPAVARSIKEACGWICQGCGKTCRRPGEPFQGHRYTLTVAHTYPPDHAPDAAVVCVAALCAPCHLRFDAERKARARRAKRGSVSARLPLVKCTI